MAGLTCGYYVNITCFALLTPPSFVEVLAYCRCLNLQCPTTSHLARMVLAAAPSCHPSPRTRRCQVRPALHPRATVLHSHLWTLLLPQSLPSHRCRLPHPFHLVLELLLQTPASIASS